MPTTKPRIQVAFDPELASAVAELGGKKSRAQAVHDLDGTLSALPAAPVTRSAGAAAISASRELRGDRRMPAADYLIAAAAAGRGAGVLHYDRHFDSLCRALGVESVWICEAGSIA